MPTRRLDGQIHKVFPVSDALRPSFTTARAGTTAEALACPARIASELATGVFVLGSLAFPRGSGGFYGRVQGRQSAQKDHGSK